VTGTARIVAVGDLMLGDSATCVGFGTGSRHREHPDALFASVRPRWRGADIVFGNLESPLTSCGVGPTHWHRDQMRGDPAMGRALAAAGFTAIGVANNHAMQHGRAGFDETIEGLRAGGIAVVGVRGTSPWTCAPTTVTSRTGLRVGMLGYCWRPRQYGVGEPAYAEGSVDDACADIRRLRGECDVVVVSLHWGDEFVTVSSLADTAAADRLIEAGAALLIGHHPHVARPIVPKVGALVAHSLGNCVTDMLWMPPLRRGLLVDCTVTANGVSTWHATALQVDDDYRPVPGGHGGVSALPVTPISDEDYQSRVRSGLRTQRLAAYRYAARHLHRFPLRIIGTLLATTLRNHLASFTRPGPRAS
jgi:poly-gamma-glutamate synthesis protein (capsule biosynthesis protein)